MVYNKIYRAIRVRLSLLDNVTIKSKNILFIVLVHIILLFIFGIAKNSIGARGYKSHCTLITDTDCFFELFVYYNTFGFIPISVI